MLDFIAHSDGKVIVPDEPVELPEGCKLRVHIELEDEGNAQPREEPEWLRTAREIAKQMPQNLPEDLAEQHDHYLYGTPKR